MRPKKILQVRRQAHNLLRLRPWQLSTIQEHQCPSISTTFYQTANRLRSTPQSQWQNTRRYKRSLTSAKRNASESPSSINETNNFSIPRSNASSDTSGSLRMPNINPKTIPTAMMVLQFLAAVPYAIEGNVRMSVYWIAAGVLTLAVTWL